MKTVIERNESANRFVFFIKLLFLTHYVRSVAVCSACAIGCVLFFVGVCFCVQTRVFVYAYVFVSVFACECMHLPKW